MEMYLGTVVMWAPSFAPQYFMYCAGQQLQIQQYTALYALLGTTWGGDGRTTFNLPNMAGRVAMGTSPSRPRGAFGGAETQTIGIANLPPHAHGLTHAEVAVRAVTDNGTSASPSAGAALATFKSGDARGSGSTYAPFSQNNVALGGTSLAGSTDPVGMATPISVLQPFATLDFIICVLGLFPPRND